MTKEECLKSLSALSLGNYCFDNITSKYPYLKYEYDCLFELIDKYFDNPPLKFEELKQMKGIPVWNNEEKEWHLISDVYKPFVLNQYIRENATAIKMVSPNGSTKLIGLNCEEILNIEDFKESVFYRKQVEE